MPSAAEAIAAAHGIFEQLGRDATQGAINAPSLNDPNSVSYGYWRKPDGWIRLSQFGQNSMDALLRGHQMLPRYGQFSPPGGAGPSDPLRQDPLVMLVRNGGAHEVRPAQVQSLGWHRRPTSGAKGSHRLVWETVENAIARGADEKDAIEQALPQLKESDWREWIDHKCQFCPQRVFNSSEDVARHESVMHKEDVRTRELRESISSALKEGGGNQNALMEVVVTLLARMGDQNQESRDQVNALLAALAENKAEAAPKQRRGRPAEDAE